jgi:hypothetical protein
MDLGASAHHVEKGHNILRCIFWSVREQSIIVALLCCCSALYSPCPFAASGVAVALLSADILRPATAVAALLNASGSEDPQRGPYQA